MCPMIGLPATFSNTFGSVNVCGRSRLPKPATGMMALIRYGVVSASFHMRQGRDDRAPNRIRTGVTSLKSSCPRPLDDGGESENGREHSIAQTRTPSDVFALFQIFRSDIPEKPPWVSSGT